MNLSRLTRWLAPAALTLVMFLVTAWSPPASKPFSNVASVRARLDSVLSELPQHDVSAFNTKQLERRAALLTTLRSYRNAGFFPHNYDFPGQTVPYFTDRKTGALCAVGYLLASTGRQDIVTRLTRADNNVRVRNLAGDAELVAWLNENGLTLDEAIRIQVPYGMSGAQASQQIAVLVTTPFVLGTSLVTGAWNASSNSDGHRVGPAVVGLVSGVASLALGATMSSTRGIPKSSGIVMAGVGVASIGFAIHSFKRRNSIAATQAAAHTSVMSTASFTPLIGMGSNPSAGVAVSLRF